MHNLKKCFHKPKLQTPLHRSIFVSRRIIIPIMVNRIFLGLFLIVSLHLSGISATLSERNIQPLMNLPSNIRLNDILKTRDNTCGGLWSREGTVCDKSKLLDHYNTEKTKIKESLDYIKKIVALLHRLDKALSSEKIMDTDQISTEEKASILDWANPASHQKLLDNADKCWTYFQGMRSSALCIVCSANNYIHYFNNKALITEDDCGKMIDNCQDHFDNTISIIRATMASLKALLHVKMSKFKEMLNGRHLQLEVLAKRIEVVFRAQKDKVDIIKFLFTYTEGILTKQTSRDQMCGHFFRVTAKPAILIIRDLARSTVMKMLPVVTLINTIDSDISNWIKSARMLGGSIDDNVLDSEEDVENAFTSDTVIMKKSDNMFSAFDGAKGTTLGQLNPDVKPMSFDSLFP